MRKKMKLSSIILSQGIVIALCFTAIFAWLYPKVKQNMYQAKYTKTRHLVEAAASLIEGRDARSVGGAEVDDYHIPFK